MTVRDLRLVPAALVGYVVTWWLVASEPRTALVMVAATVAGALLAAAARALVLARHPALLVTGVLVPDGAAHPRPGPRGVRERAVQLLARVLRGGTGQVVLVAGAVMILSLAAGAQLHAGRSGVLPLLVEAGATGTVTGTVLSEPRPTSPGFDGEPRYVRTVTATTVSGRVDGVPTSGPAHGEVVVLGGSELLSPGYGATVEVEGRLLPVDPGSAATAMLALGPGTSSTSPPLREVAPPGAVLSTVGTIRSAFLEVAATLPEQARGLVPGVAVGDTSMMSPGLDHAMKTTSLTHVTAVSGAHFAIIFATVTGLCALLRLPLRARVPVAGTAMLGFVLLVHPEPSVLRAAVMSSVTLGAVLVGRPAQSLTALCVAVLVLLAVDPFLARTYGFVLSVLGTAGIVVGTRPIAAWLGRLLPRWLALAVAVPLAAQMACGPVIILLDPFVPTYSVPANLIATPALVPATVLGVAGALAAPWWPQVSSGLSQVAGWATWWIAEVAERFAAAPLARVPWVEGAPGVALLAAVTVLTVVVVGRWGSLVWAVRTGVYVAGLGAAPSSPRQSLWDVLLRRDGGRGTRPAQAAARPLARPVAVLACVALGLGVVWQTQPPWLADLVRPGGTAWSDDWQVVMCDVGQGDALVVRTGPGAAVMVDVGPAGDAAARCLDELGVTTLDLLVLTHFHHDHVGGLPEVLAGREVQQVYVSPVHDPATHAATVARQLDDAGVPWEEASASTHANPEPLLTGPAPEEVRWDVLAPAEDVAAGTGDRAANDSSVVLALRTPDLSIIALGDLETAGQASLLRTLVSDGTGAVDVVKMAHHGSRTQDPALAHHLSPSVTLVSAGADNTYGHPTESALDLYASTGSAILRTDTCGTVGLVVREEQTLVAGGCS